VKPKAAVRIFKEAKLTKDIYVNFEIIRSVWHIEGNLKTKVRIFIENE